MKLVFQKNITFLIFFAFFVVSLAKNTLAEQYNAFIDKVDDIFNENENYDNTSAQIGILEDGSNFDFSETLKANYLNFAQSRYNSNDFIDAYYFKTKAMKIAKYKLISPANPYSFGIIPDDIEQFAIAREQLRNVSINSIINSNDGLVLADSYIAYDCWLEAFEEGNSYDRMNRCRNRFLDNMKAMRLSLLMQGYNVFDMTTKENLALNNRYAQCESCDLYKKGLYCNAIYFEPEEIKTMDKMNVVVKRLQQKMTYFNSAKITILYYKNAYGFNEKLSKKRLEAMKNLATNVLAKNRPITPNIKITPITLPKKMKTKKIYRDAITICISGNE